MNRGFGIGVPAMGPGAGFGANNGRVMQSRGRPSYAPGAVQSQSMMMPGQGEDVEELLAMLEAQSRGQNRPPAAMHAQPGPMPPQAPAPAQQFPASPVQAPKDRGMFGRFLGGLGKVAGKAGEFAMFGPVGMQIRADHRRGLEKEEQKTAEEEARRRLIAQSLNLNPELFVMDPAMAMNDKYRGQDIEREDLHRTQDIKHRDLVFNTQTQQWEKGYNREGDWRADDVEYRDTQAKEDARRFGLTYGLDLRGVEAAEAKARAEENATPSVDFGDVKGVRETNEKRFQAFEESQRAFQSMAGLAKQGTGAADIALGFAFFKTFDPNSTVREGEFAQAASAMGLGDRAISILARLDAGEQFTPQLREELVKAASVAYNNQAQDITGLVRREREFADRHGINRQDIARNPIVRIPPPPEAVNELLSNPTPEEIAEFNATFGYGQGEAIVARARRREYGGMNR